MDSVHIESRSVSKDFQSVGSGAFVRHLFDAFGPGAPVSILVSSSVALKVVIRSFDPFMDPVTLFVPPYQTCHFVGSGEIAYQVEAMNGDPKIAANVYMAMTR